MFSVKKSKILCVCVCVCSPADLEEQGMYRVSGLTSEILELKERFDSGDKVDFSRYTDISVVCGAVKLYLRELPIPVISFDAYNDVMKAASKFRTMLSCVQNLYITESIGI